MKDVEARKPLFLGHDIAFPLFAKRLDDSFHPDAKLGIIINKIVQVVREAMLKVTARGRCPASKIKPRINLIDGANHSILKRIERIEVKRVGINHEATRDVFRAATLRGNQSL